ncbi:single-stranded DNA-binding protein [Demetria terragena]|uniref:single-stranded DNA-binding protein n=1 Tax=Demetria terragena TaxID=63959 RepID=UPI00039DF8CA|nr:single-stranded DNA-binding protein [Demetria terragena]
MDKAYISSNEVRLVGRVSAAAEERTLPSGDVLVTFRISVPRETHRRSPGARQGRTPSVDAIDIACFTAATRRRALRFKDGERVEVAGALRRRFFRTARGTESRYDVEATGLRKAPAQ